MAQRPKAGNKQSMSCFAKGEKRTIQFFCPELLAGGEPS